MKSHIRDNAEHRGRSCFVLLLSAFLAWDRVYSIISISFTLYGCINIHDRDLRYKCGVGAIGIFYFFLLKLSSTRSHFNRYQWDFRTDVNRGKVGLNAIPWCNMSQFKKAKRRQHGRLHSKSYSSMNKAANTFLSSFFFFKTMILTELAVPTWHNLLASGQLPVHSISSLRCSKCSFTWVS